MPRINAHFNGIFCLLICLLPANAWSETYIYVERDGTRWITDRQLIDKRFTYVAKYGRPTATRSCMGVTPHILEQRAEPFMTNVYRFSSEHNIDPFLVKALITVESCFDARAVSRAGAKGLMQLMPSIAHRYQVFDRFHPEENLRAGITHLSTLLQRYKNNLELSLAAYNAGAGAVEKYRTVPPYKETQQYVKKVLAYYHSYSTQNPQ